VQGMRVLPHFEVASSVSGRSSIAGCLVREPDLTYHYVSSNLFSLPFSKSLEFYVLFLDFLVSSNGKIFNNKLNFGVLVVVFSE
jgi:hypothetical protein